MTDVNNLSSMGGFINKKIKPLKDEISIIKTELKNIKKQLTLTGVSQQRELLNYLADDFNDSTDTYVGQERIENVLKAFNCG